MKKKMNRDNFRVTPAKMPYELWRWAVGNWMAESDGERGAWRQLMTEDQRRVVAWLDLRSEEVERYALNLLAAHSYEVFCDASSAPEGGDLPLWWC